MADGMADELTHYAETHLAPAAAKRIEQEIEKNYTP